MTGWKERFLGIKPKGDSADQAKDRLRLVLIHDRTDLSPGALEALKNDLIQTISRYIDIDETAVRIAMNHEGREQRLIADIPLRITPRRKNG